MQSSTAPPPPSRPGGSFREDVRLRQEKSPAVKAARLAVPRKDKDLEFDDLDAKGAASPVEIATDVER